MEGNNNYADSKQTCWTMIQNAAGGQNSARENFVQLYQPAVRAYLASRWHLGPHSSKLDDAVQDVFLECFRDGGVLNKADPLRGGGFRAYLFGVVRNVARRHEILSAVQPLAADPLDAGTGCSTDFDREFARAMMRESSRIQGLNAEARGVEALRRHELLRLRFHENLPIREIADRWQVDPTWLHHQYATARQEFRTALKQVVQFHHPESTDSELNQICRDLLQML